MFLSNLALYFYYIWIDPAPLHRYFNGKDHFYTRNATEIGTTTAGVVGKGGYKSEGRACTLSSSPNNGLSPLYRYWNGKDHFYTTNGKEIGTTKIGVVGKFGYKSEGIAGYCYNTWIPTTLPLYRYWNGADHFYTINKAEIGTIVVGKVGKFNYKYEGIACFVRP